MNNWLNRTEYLIGIDNISKLKKSHVAVFGCGGVGSYVIEALARSGVGSLTLIDKDVVDITNINRQLIADTTTIGMPKVEVEKERLLRINPTLRVTTYQMFYDASHADEILNTNFDYVIDAIDCVTSKINLVEECFKRKIPIICSMGTGNKLDPTKFEISDISKTSVCPLASYDLLQTRLIDWVQGIHENTVDSSIAFIFFNNRNFFKNTSIVPIN
jgi:tRNA A37 threonylcarbamoyladenosine dehydratase